MDYFNGVIPSHSAGELPDDIPQLCHSYSGLFLDK